MPVRELLDFSRSSTAALTRMPRSSRNTAQMRTRILSESWRLEVPKDRASDSATALTITVMTIVFFLVLFYFGKFGRDGTFSSVLQDNGPLV